MTTVVDTPIWSLALRRAGPQRSQVVAELRRLIARDDVVMLGVVRQELLSGIAEEDRFAALRSRLHAFADTPVVTTDYEEAARYANVCRRRGIQSTPVDVLLCAVAVRLDAAVFTTDRDFELYAEHLPIRLHEAP